MDICTTFNPERLVQLGGEPYWVRALTLADFAVILAWLDDVLPGRDARKMPPEFGSDDAQKALESAHGLSLLTWLALRGQGVGYPRAVEIALACGEVERYRLMQVLFARRRTMRPGPDGEDLGVSWWGPVVASLAEACYFPPSEVGGMTLDQLELVCMSRDRLKEEDPRHLTLEDVIRMGEQKRAAMAAQEEAAHAG